MDDTTIYRSSGTSWWAYTDRQTEVGVRIEGDHLLWYEQAIFNPHSGAWGAHEQSFDDFLSRGPAHDDWMSDAALAELSTAVHERRHGEADHRQTHRTDPSRVLHSRTFGEDREE